MKENLTNIGTVAGAWLSILSLETRCHGSIESKHFYLDSHINVFCFSFSLWSGAFYLGHVKIFSCNVMFRYAVAEWYGAGLAIVRSLVRIPPTAAVYQRQLSVPSLRGRLMSTSESWGVNGHTTRCTSPVSVVLWLRLVSGWGLRKRRSAPPHGP